MAEVKQNIEKPTITATVSNDLDCKKTNTILNATTQNAKLEWFFDSKSLGNQANIEVSEKGEYRAKATNDKNGCSNEILVTVKENVEKPFVTAIASNDLDCKHTKSTLSASAKNAKNMEYEWFKNNISIAKTPNFEVDKAGEYRVKITNLDNDCSDLSSVSLIAWENPEAKIKRTGEIRCPGDKSLVLFAEASKGKLPYNYLWSNNEVTSIIQGIGAGNYTVTVTDANGCTQLAEEILREPEPITATFETKNPMRNGSSLGFIKVTPVGGTPPYTFNWTEPLKGKSYTSQNIENAGSGIYSLTITDANGCTWVLDKPITLISLSSVASEELREHLIYQVVPNPFEQSFVLKLRDSEIAALSYNILNSSGQVVVSSTIQTTQTEIPINMSDFPKGVYLLQVRNEEGVTTQRILKE
jgi:hypothetical protein